VFNSSNEREKVSTPRQEIAFSTIPVKPKLQRKGAECAIKLPRRNRCNGLTVDRLICRAEATKACYRSGNGIDGELMIVIKFKGQKSRAYTRAQLEQLFN